MRYCLKRKITIIIYAGISNINKERDFALTIHEVFKLNKWSRRMPFNLLVAA
jgi:hypothetical protein